MNGFRLTPEAKSQEQKFLSFKVNTFAFWFIDLCLNCRSDVGINLNFILRDIDVDRNVQARCIAPYVADPQRTRFLVGTQSLREENEVNT